MKKILTLIACCYILDTQSQIVFTEIMYNPPESGTDVFEFVEIHNTSSSVVNLQDYRISAGVEFVFPNVNIPANGYLVIAQNPTQFDSLFGFTPLQWTSGNFNNSGERLELLNPTGIVVDSLTFSDRNGWPTKADGEGHSLELCRVTADNSKKEYWKASNRLTSHVINGLKLYCSPGLANTVECAEHDIQVRNFSFIPANIVINKGECIEWTNIQGLHNVNGTKATFPNNPVSFFSGPPANATWSFIACYDVAGAYSYQCDLHAGGGMIGSIVVNEVVVGYPPYPIGLVTSTNSNGIVDSFDVNSELEGIVYGVNMRPQGLSFTLIDNFNDGINVFSNAAKFGYTVKEGDRIKVRGQIKQFSGLIEILPDTIIFNSANNGLVMPEVVTVLNENTESQLVKLNNVNLVDATQWNKANPNGFTVIATNGTNNFTIRIDNDVDLYNMAAPTGTFSITGIGGQLDPDIPYLDGYQLFPRYVADINPYIPSGGGITYHKATVDAVTKNNAAGVPDSISKNIELTGIVYGIDFNGGTGVQFSLIDNTGGIGVFNANNSFGYVVLQADEITVLGKIAQFGGLTQITADTIIKIGGNRNLNNPRLVTDLNETTESELITLENLNIVNAADWKGDGSSFNVRASDGTKEFIVRIDDNSNLSSQPIGGSKLTVTGLGSQFDNTSPFLEGYQIMPRYIADIQWSTSTDNPQQSQIKIMPNPIHDYLNIETNIPWQFFEVYDLTGKRHWLGEFTPQIDVCNLQSGTYILRCFNSNQQQIQSFIKQ